MLSRQLAIHRKENPSASTNILNDKNQQSILNPKDASYIRSPDSLLNDAIKAFRELEEISLQEFGKNVLKPFANQFLGLQSLRFHRSSLSSAQNKVYHMKLSSMIRLLGVFLQEEISQSKVLTVLEYLVYKFEINTYEADLFIIQCLPFIEKSFVQTLLKTEYRFELLPSDLSKHFGREGKKSDQNVLLSRTSIAKVCSKNLGFLGAAYDELLFHNDYSGILENTIFARRVSYLAVLLFESLNFASKYKDFENSVVFAIKLGFQCLECSFLEVKKSSIFVFETVLTLTEVSLPILDSIYFELLEASLEEQSLFQFVVPFFKKHNLCFVIFEKNLEKFDRIVSEYVAKGCQFPENFVDLLVSEFIKKRCSYQLSNMIRVLKIFNRINEEVIMLYCTRAKYISQIKDYLVQNLEKTGFDFISTRAIAIFDEPTSSESSMPLTDAYSLLFKAIYSGRNQEEDVSLTSDKLSSIILKVANEYSNRVQPVNLKLKSAFVVVLARVYEDLSDVDVFNKSLKFVLRDKSFKKGELSLFISWYNLLTKKSALSITIGSILVLFSCYIGFVESSNLQKEEIEFMNNLKLTDLRYLAFVALGEDSTGYIDLCLKSLGSLFPKNSSEVKNVILYILEKKPSVNLLLKVLSVQQRNKISFSNYNFLDSSFKLLTLDDFGSIFDFFLTALRTGQTGDSLSKYTWTKISISMRCRIVHNFVLLSINPVFEGECLNFLKKKSLRGEVLYVLSLEHISKIGELIPWELKELMKLPITNSVTLSRKQQFRNFNIPIKKKEVSIEFALQNSVIVVIDCANKVKEELAFKLELRALLNILSIRLQTVVLETSFVTRLLGQLSDIVEDVNHDKTSFLSVLRLPRLKGPSLKQFQDWCYTLVSKELETANSFNNKSFLLSREFVGENWFLLEDFLSVTDEKSIELVFLTVQVMASFEAIPKKILSFIANLVDIDAIIVFIQESSIEILKLFGKFILMFLEEKVIGIENISTRALKIVNTLLILSDVLRKKNTLSKESEVAPLLTSLVQNLATINFKAIDLCINKGGSIEVFLSTKIFEDFENNLPTENWFELLSLVVDNKLCYSNNAVCQVVSRKLISLKDSFNEKVEFEKIDYLIASVLFLNEECSLDSTFKIITSLFTSKYVDERIILQVFIKLKGFTLDYEIDVLRFFIGLVTSFEAKQSLLAEIDQEETLKLLLLWNSEVNIDINILDSIDFSSFTYSADLAQLKNEAILRKVFEEINLRTLMQLCTTIYKPHSNNNALETTMIPLLIERLCDDFEDIPEILDKLASLVVLSMDTSLFHFCLTHKLIEVATVIKVFERSLEMNIEANEELTKVLIRILEEYADNTNLILTVMTRAKDLPVHDIRVRYTLIRYFSKAVDLDLVIVDDERLTQLLVLVYQPKDILGYIKKNQDTLLARKVFSTFIEVLAFEENLTSDPLIHETFCCLLETSTTDNFFFFEQAVSKYILLLNEYNINFFMNKILYRNSLSKEAQEMYWKVTKSVLGAYSGFFGYLNVIRLLTTAQELFSDAFMVLLSSLLSLGELTLSNFDNSEEAAQSCIETFIGLFLSLVEKPDLKKRKSTSLTKTLAILSAALLSFLINNRHKFEKIETDVVVVKLADEILVRFGKAKDSNILKFMNDILREFGYTECHVLLPCFGNFLRLLKNNLHLNEVGLIVKDLERRTSKRLNFLLKEFA